MKTTFKIDFEGDIYELQGNNLGKEVLYRNGEVLLETRNLFKTGNEYEFHCPRRGTLRLWFNMDTNRRVVDVKILKEEELLEEYHESMEHLLPEWVKKLEAMDEEGEEEGEGEAPKNSGKKVLYGLLSLGAAMVIWGWMFSWVYALVLVLVLFVHEMGHYFAMVALGYKKTGFVFTPPLGALAYGVKKNAREREKVLVLLAGPLPGILIGGILFFFGPRFLSESLAMALAIQFLILNYINLLPISPLDGGRIVEILFLHKFPRLQLVLAGVGLVLIGGYGIFIRSFLVMVIALLFAWVLVGRVYELKNQDKEKIQGEELSLLGRVFLGGTYLAFLALGLGFALFIF